MVTKESLRMAGHDFGVCEAASHRLIAYHARQ